MKNDLSPDQLTQLRRPRHWRAPIALAVLAAALLAAGILPKLHASAQLTQQVDAQQAIPVQVLTPRPAPATQELLLPGNVMPFADTSVFARTSGYIASWNSDIGAHVKAGATLAVIKTPELDAELRQARADAASAQANYDISHVTAQRWQVMAKTQAVAPQEVDTKVADMQAKQALLAAAQANVARLAEMVSYEKVVAPFDGIVTARNVDVGALVTAGGASGTGAVTGELFHVQQTSTLRVFVDVPQSDAMFVKPGTPAYLMVQQYPGRHFTATVARANGAIDPSSRTMRVEIDVDNRDGLLLPGAYAQVHLALTVATPALELPDSALLFRPNGVTVATVGANGRVALQTVSVGRDFGTRSEITSGLTSKDVVIDNPGDALANGQPVRVVRPGAAS
jgi:membrane fusion protein, multidrug efflux system